MKNNIENSSLKVIKTFRAHNDGIRSMSSFPSGKLISVSMDKSIKIWDINFNLIQIINEAHEFWINYVCVKDENNFLTCSLDRNIKIWIYKENIFILNKSIINAHDDKITKLIYYSNGDFISCSVDKKIKIWEEVNDHKCQIKSIIIHSSFITSILLLEDKNFLVTSGHKGTFFWNINNNEYIFSIGNTECFYSGNSICRLDEYKIIIGGFHIISIISILEKKIIKKINNIIDCWGVYFIKYHNIFLGIGNRNIRIYSKDSYNCIQNINDVHDKFVNGIIYLKNGYIASYSIDETIKIWSY
jgi:WD40 repeat protein